jgi:hypothetical protein
MVCCPDMETLLCSLVVPSQIFLVFQVTDEVPSPVDRSPSMFNDLMVGVVLLLVFS